MYFLEVLVKFFLLNEQLSNLLHVHQVAEICQSKVDVPYIVLVLVNLTSARILPHFRLHRIDVLDPCVIDARQVLNCLLVGLLIHNYRVIHRLHCITVDLSFDLILHLLERKHRTPEGESDKQVKEDYHKADQVLCDFYFIFSPSDAL